MDFANLHAWDIPRSEAAELQKRLARQIDVQRPLEKCERIAGVDCSYNRFSPTLFAAVVVLQLMDGSIVEAQGAVGASTFPYIPGYLSFRELPLLLQAFARLQCRPDAIMVDGQGIAHPRRLGIACHLGLWLQIPTFGCGKSRLIGTHEEPGPQAGDRVPLYHHDEVLGSVVRTKNRTKPVYISPGHLIDRDSAVHWTLQSCRGYRIPEPTRQAHLHVNQMRLRHAEGMRG